MQQNANIQKYVLTDKFFLAEERWFRKYKQLSKNEPHHVLLESGRGGRYTIIGLQPFAILEGKNRTLTITTKQNVRIVTGDLLTLMKDWMDNYKVEKLEGDYSPFQCGAIGFLSYDIAREIENIPSCSKDDLQMADLYFLVFDFVFVYDHHLKELCLYAFYFEGEKEGAERRLLAAKKAWLADAVVTDWGTIEEIKENEPARLASSFSKQEFQQAIEKIRDYIAAGDTFQVNLSLRQCQKLKTAPLHIYEKLRELNPSPYMAYLHSPHFQLVSGSPELLVKKRGNEVSTRPIAGTRPRGANAVEDENLAKTLIENEKERAEHIMLVDLERNDLGKVCQFGTVDVNEWMVIEKYSHVMHIVSNVKGTLAPSKDVFDIIKATFPGGTITGAPKVRTMEIIEELEPVRRGIYTGSIGWIGFNGEMELNIVIRTLLAKDGLAYVQAGAGVVIDSDPEAEYKEALKKAEALWWAKEMSEEEIKRDFHQERASY